MKIINPQRGIVIAVIWIVFLGKTTTDSLKNSQDKTLEKSCRVLGYSCAQGCRN